MEPSAGARELVALFLTAPQLNAVIAGLQELPWKHAQPVLQEIQRQLDGIARAKAEPKEGGEKEVACG